MHRVTEENILQGLLLHVQGAAQAPPAASAEAWRQNFRPLDEGLQTTPKLETIPDMAPADSAKIKHGQGAAAEKAASSMGEVSRAPNGAAEREGGAGASSGPHELAPAKSGKLESKERISSMLYQGPSGKDSAMEGVNSEPKKEGKKMGCFGSRSKAKESSKPCVIF